MKKELVRARRHPLRNVYASMMHRCYNPKSISFRYYGARGITVCEQWRQSFDTFLNDMGPRPSKVHSIDRRNNDDPYGPDNCRWATSLEQCANKRNTRLYSYNGRTHHLSDWARIASIEYATLRMRVVKLRWPMSKALSTPIRDCRDSVVRPGNRTLTFRGETKSVAAWARQMAWRHHTILRRLNRGWTPEEALTRPLEQHPRGQNYRRHHGVSQ